MSLPTLLGYQRASAFVNATKLASQPLFSSDEEYKISNVLSNTFFIDIDHVSIAIHIVIVLSPSPTFNAPYFEMYSNTCFRMSFSYDYFIYSLYYLLLMSHFNFSLTLFIPVNMKRFI